MRLILEGLLCYVLWGFVEYVYHRRQHSNEGSHQTLHHNGLRDGPTARTAYWTIGIGVFSLIFAGFHEITWMFALAGCLLVRLSVFVVLHSLYHNMRGNNIWLLKDLRAHHLLHHRAKGNYGVTTRYWDWLFKTALTSK